MNYQNTYNSIIKNAKDRNWQKGDVVLETHHIIPRSCGGGNEKDNLVNLTPREHFVCHLLLVKLYEGTEFYTKMIRASVMMTRGSVNSRIYQRIKQIHVENLRQQVISEKQKKAISIANTGNKGRTGHKNNDNQRKANALVNGRKSRGIFTEREKESFKKLAEMNRRRCIGKKPANTMQIEYNGVVYQGWDELSESTGITRWMYLNNSFDPSKKAVCIHCGKQTTTNTINRWHNDNCKEKI